MAIRAITSPGAPAPSGPYSQAVVVDRQIFLAGQRPVDPVTGEIPQDFQSQVDQALTNVRAVLHSAGAELSDVVKVTVYLVDLSDFERLNSVFRTWFSEPYPVRTTVGVRLRDVLVEIDVTAVLSEDSEQRLPSTHEGAPL